MKVLLVHAHPEPRSFCAAMKDRAAAVLRAGGHEVVISDLYAMRFDPVAKADDFASRRDPEYLVYALEQRHAFETGTLAPDIAAEVEKVLAADLLILSFPLFWFSVPAILKGWIDRVFLSGLFYGGRRFYDRGGLVGKRALCLITAGARSSMLAEGGIHGPLEGMLRHLLQGTLGYVGYRVPRPFVAWHVPYVDRATREGYLAALERYLSEVATLEPLPMPSLDRFDAAMRPIPSGNREG
ncbi:MAG: NAD(P)H-dependent oxidoreductase [Geminicoccaceae bacterium]|nr:NAD(P)H-dependent oxidoreductase [Geminicoccaceae bacterium]MCX8100875.1 NAD(P)H-dependent oxidoreductase [Geminicoccaceae bacterium]MDW8370110.1 NAD(P)H-dependent oxidoreductase [Geminicoccaceae bacterium]